MRYEDVLMSVLKSRLQNLKVNSKYVSQILMSTFVRKRVGLPKPLVT